MSDAVYETNTVTLKADTKSKDYKFKASSTKVKFEGFLAVYKPDEEKKDNTKLTNINEKDVLEVESLEEKQHFTQPPTRYTESLLVRTMEELGIGRPSTYAPTISTLLARRYIVKEAKNLYMTELGEAVNEIMNIAFPEIVDTSFTANIESLLDDIEIGNINWKIVIKNFYPDLKKSVDNAQKELEHIKIEDEVSDTKCELCGRMMVVKYGSNGKFLACPGFPDCKNTKPYFEKTGVKCPKCNADIVIKKTRKGRRYYGCVNNPECDFMSWSKPQTENISS